jgi:hypothetical protein
MSALEFAGDFLQRNSPLREEHEEVVDEIGSFGHQFRRGFVLGGDDRLGGLFSQFLEDLVESAVEQIRRVTPFRTRLLATLDQFRQFEEEDFQTGLDAETGRTERLRRAACRSRNRG